MTWWDDGRTILQHHSHLQLLDRQHGTQYSLRNWELGAPFSTGQRTPHQNKRACRSSVKSNVYKIEWCAKTSKNITVWSFSYLGYPQLQRTVVSADWASGVGMLPHDLSLHPQSSWIQQFFYVQNGFPCLTGNCCAGKIVSSRTHPYYLSKETVDLSNCLFWTLETKSWRSSMFSGMRLSIECHIVSADRAHCGMWSEVVLKRGNVRSISIVFLQTLESLEYNNYYTV